MRIAIIRKGKTVGYVDGQTYYTFRGEDTIFRRYNSVNISASVLEEIHALGVVYVEMTYRSKMEEAKYVVELQRFLTGILYLAPNDVQRCVPLEMFRPLKENKQGNLNEYFAKEGG